MKQHINTWNQNQKYLREKLEKAGNFSETKPLLLTHHAMLHSSAVGTDNIWSYPDEIWQELEEMDFRIIPEKQEHSLIWVFWHIARIEDMTMNILVADSPQVLHTQDFLNRMNAPFEDTGNEITPDKMSALNLDIDIDALRAYRTAVGQRTQAIIKDLPEDRLREKVDTDRIEVLRCSGAVVKDATGIIDYWSKRTIAGLLLMPATRHNLVHLNEATRIKKAILKSK